MAQLKTDFSELLTDEHIESLNKANIWTINDYFSRDLMEIKRLTNIKYSVLKDLHDKIKQRYTLPCHTLSYLIDRKIKEECRIFPTGLPELTQALDGGFQTEEIIEFFGPTESGKTEMCLLICGQILSHYDNYNILYVASDFDFSYEKIAKYIRSKSGRSDMSEDDIHNCLTRVEIARPTKLADLMHLLNTLVHSDKKNKFKCIIIDSLSFIIQEVILDIRTANLADGDELERFSGLSNNHANSFSSTYDYERIRWDIIDTYVDELMKLLTTVAITKNTIIVITNSDEQLTYSKPWTNASSHRIHLDKMSEFSSYYLNDPKSTVCRATIVKTIHNITKIGYSIPFAINDEGLFVVRLATTTTGGPSTTDTDNAKDSDNFDEDLRDRQATSTGATET